MRVSCRQGVRSWELGVFGGLAVLGVELLRIGREATREREAGVAVQNAEIIFLPHYQHTKQSYLQLFALSRSRKKSCRIFATDKRQQTTANRHYPEGVRVDRRHPEADRRP